MNKYFIIMITCASSFTVYSRHNVQAFTDFEHYDEIFDEVVEVVAQEPDVNLHQTRCNETPADAIETIIAVGGVDLLRNNVYIRTNPLNKRVLNDLPIYTLHTYKPTEENCHFWYLRSDLFFNKTDQAYFTKESPFIRSYIGLDQQDLINQLDRINIDNVNIPLSLALFKNVKIEERRAGLMFDALKLRKNWIFECRTFFLYQERNFFLNSMEQDALRKSKLFDENQDKEMEFAQHHLISDRIGFDDTRVYIGRIFVDDCRLWLHSGLQLTIPTGAIGTVYNGYFGSHFNKKMGQPTFDILEFLNLRMPGTPCTNPRAAELMGEAFLEGVLDRLSTMVLEDDLGNSGHLGIGIYEEHQLIVSQKLTFLARSSLEYLTPVRESRFYIFEKNQAAFDKVINDFNTDPDNEQLATQNLNFLEQQLISTLYPMAILTHVQPGLIFNLTGALSGSFKEYWVATLGYDLWIQGQEKIKPVLKSVASIPGPIEKEIAIKPSAYQSKVFFLINYHKYHTSFDWGLTFAGDYTLLNGGIGRDYTISLGLMMVL